MEIESIQMKVPKRYKDEIRKAAKANGQSMTQYLLSCHELANLVEVQKTYTIKE